MMREKNDKYENVIILPCGLIAEFNPAHENNAAKNRKAHNFTGD